MMSSETRPVEGVLRAVEEETSKARGTVNPVVDQIGAAPGLVPPVWHLRAVLPLPR